MGYIFVFLTMNNYLCDDITIRESPGGGYLYWIENGFVGSEGTAFPDPSPFSSTRSLKNQDLQ